MNKVYLKKASKSKLELAIINLNLNGEIYKGRKVNSSSFLKLSIYGKSFIKSGYVLECSGDVIGWITLTTRDEIHMFLKKEWRGRGLFKKFVYVCNRHFSGGLVCPWNEETFNLFSYFNLNCSKRYYNEKKYQTT